MFYQTEPEKVMRFGDVLEGYFLSTPIITDPNPEKPLQGCQIKLGLPKYTIVMDPDCKTEHKMISLSPLIEIWGTFFDNPYWAEDLTRINRQMEPEQSVQPHIWSTLPPDEKQKRLEIGRTYAFENLFVYEPHSLLKEYTVNRRSGNKDTNYYMVDFRNVFKLFCDKIISPTDAPLESKMLQLSDDARHDLQNKIAAYYGTE